MNDKKIGGGIFDLCINYDNIDHILFSQRLPECNAVWSAAETPQPLRSVDVSVVLYSNSGLITGLLKDVNSLGILDLHQAIKVRVHVLHPSLYLYHVHTNWVPYTLAKLAISYCIFHFGYLSLD